MGSRILVFYGSYRTDRKGIRLADFTVRRLRARGEDTELIDAKAIGLPILDRMLKEYAPATAPVAIASYSAGRLSGTRSSYAWRNTLSEMGMIVISSTLTVGPIAETLDETGEPIGKEGGALERAFSRFADDLAWWTEAAKKQRVNGTPPY